MYFSSVLLLVLFTTLISADPDPPIGPPPPPAPAPIQIPLQIPLQNEKLLDESLEAQSCTTKLPTSYQQITRSSPQKSFPQNNIFNVNQTNGGKDNTDTLLSFTGIPDGSYGCQLAISFPPNYPIISSGGTQLNVYALPRPISASDTYATYFPDGGRGIPVDSYLFGTITITGKPAVVNSQVCRPSLGYLFEIASDTAAGSVTFVDAGNKLSVIGGFYLTYNC